MKKSPLSQPHSGVALILVLAFLVLISGLILAFFSSVTNELTASKSYSSGISARQLSDTAVNSVIAAITDSTNLGGNIAWISQPGMIKTFGGAGNVASNTPLAFYKLYSSDKMVVNTGLGAFDPAADLDVSWDTKPTIFTDLNSPVIDSTATPRFPIFDPRALGNVAGFNYTTGAVNGTVSTGGNAQRLPMPVRWIYVLQDGTLTVPTGESGGVANWTGSSKPPSSTNPITGRIAFWTDDETSKININTASGDAWDTPKSDDTGSFWDTPRVKNTFDQKYLALNQPAKNEFQRYPGHPATTYLSATFSSLGLTREQIALITPKVLGGGSKGGTVKVTGPNGRETDRLYASLDEMLYQPTNRAVNDVIITPEILEQRRGFLTANSRAPELNLFNRPRISIWPITTDASGSQKTTALDKLLAFCGTIGGKKYYFERYDPNSQTNDYNIARNTALYASLKTYLQTAIPGVGGTFSAKYASDYQQILTEIVDYIRCTNLIDSSTGAVAYSSTGQVLPLRVAATQGFGRMSTLTELAIQFYAKSVSTANTGTLETKLQAVMLPEIFSPALGLPQLKNDFDLDIEGLDTFRVGVSSDKTTPTMTSTPLGFPAKTRVRVDSDPIIWHERPYGGTSGLGSVLYTKGGARTLSPTSYPFYSNEFSYFGSNGGADFAGFEFYGGLVTVRIFPTGGTTPIQTLTLKFPDSPKVMTLVAGKNGGQIWESGNGDPLNPNKSWTLPKASAAPNNDYAQRLANLNSNAGTINIISTSDNIQSIQIGNGAKADPRLIAALIAGETNPADSNYRFQEHEYYQKGGRTNEGKLDYSFITGDGTSYYRYGTQLGVYGKIISGLPAASTLTSANFSDIPSRIDNGVTRSDGLPGDFDTGMSTSTDNGYINKPDEGDSNSTGGRTPYYLTSGSIPDAPVGETLFSPNRLAPSPAIFGSLSTGVISNKPWQTLLFCKNPAGANHPGAAAPADHYLLDLFWMPVVEPYAISEPFSTAGKINLNHNLAPFTYITRTTALRAALKPLMISALKPSDLSWHKKTAGAFSSNTWRYPLDLDETISALDTRLASKPFLSASEICEVSLIPQGTTAAGIASFWSTNSMTGDNLREKPYVDLYPRLTTKSNTYTVHMRVQSLKPTIPAATAATNPRWAQWSDAKDKVQGEYRGSSIIERYVDPSDLRFTDGTINPDTQAVSPAYRFRVVSTKRFAY